jgi:hypothetical protein
MKAELKFTVSEAGKISVMGHYELVFARMYLCLIL